MPEEKSTLLIVDDEPVLLMCLSMVFAELGYPVRTASDGFAALAEMRKEVPGILLSDLNMPGMSGFELLAVVRQRFPETRVVAMSGGFAGPEVPPGVVADAFYQKGSSTVALLKVIDTLPWPKRVSAGPVVVETPIWIQKNGHGAPGESTVTTVCPECLRTSSHPISTAFKPMQEIGCVYCHTVSRYAIAGPIPVYSQSSHHGSPAGLMRTDAA